MGESRVRRIEDYALIGNCRTAALISRRGDVDWFCVPRFDGGAVFAALLGDGNNGRWTLAPDDETATATRAYVDGTLILRTEWRTATGAATVTDLMPIDGDTSDLIRIVEGVEGTVSFASHLRMRFDYGRTVPWVRSLDDNTLTAIAGPNMIVFRAGVPFENADMQTVARFEVTAGERRNFCLTHQVSWYPVRDGLDIDTVLAETTDRWRRFSDACPPAGPYTEMVRRSIITLKALTYAATGGIVAAATTSLPETIGGGRNWDYRYCWIRDSAMTLMAFIELGYLDEAAAWRDWLMRAAAGDPSQMQIMYGVAGERQLVEWTSDWLPGFRASAPVRIGNAAAGQFQLDVFGNIAEAMTMGIRGGLPNHPEQRGLSNALLRFLEANWRRPDDGIWETRGERRQFVHSKVMAWVTFDRASTIIAEAGRAEEAAQWRDIADEIHAEVCEKGFDAELNSFVQSYGSKAIDASLLQIALTGFLPPEDPRVAGTVAAIETTLMRSGLVERYDAEATDDGVATSEEGTFLICSFWLIDAYVLLGRRDEAVTLFEKVAGLANDVGLLAEEYDPAAGIMLGNFPQAFSHVGLILSALNLSRLDTPVQRRAEEGAETPVDA